MIGAVERVRPKMMTVVAIMAGLVPILWSKGAGSEIMQRIAVPMIGGMVSSTALTLVVIPALYGLVKARGLPRGLATKLPEEAVSPASSQGRARDVGRLISHRHHPAPPRGSRQSGHWLGKARTPCMT